ncbi:MAG: acyl-CoA dehydrogenase [candidate division Zixibacteria bacterium]|nr:acyl-CoA dehydrogenase [candidate division Zixibacteria bacterium]
MTYNLDPKQQAIREEVREFCKKNDIIKKGIELDRRPEPAQFPFDYFNMISDAGYMRFSFPEKYGGSGKTNLEYNTMIEEFSYHDPATSLLIAIQQLAGQPLIHFASEHLQEKYLKPAAEGKMILCFGLTEPNAGSDASNQITVAVPDGDDYIIDGEKIFIMHGDVADAGIIFCKIQEGSIKDRVSAIMVDLKGVEGVTQRTLTHKMGMKCATTGGIEFKNVRVPKTNLVGEVGKGFRYAMMTLDGARTGIGAQAVGLAQRALDEAVNYAKTRIQFGAPIAKLQAIQWMIADMSCRLEAARLLSYKASSLCDYGKRFSVEAAQAKLYASEAAGFCVDRAMQIHGGYGYIEEFSPIGKLYRDQRVIEIYEGTSEIQRLVIASGLLR